MRSGGGRGSARWFALILAGGVSLSACSNAASNPSAETTGSDPALVQCGTTIRELADSAKAEGELTLIATPREWANYGAIIDSFEADYGISVTVLDPYASSADELKAVVDLANTPGRPDVIDIGPSFVSKAIDDGLVQAYKPTTWSQIPTSLKDPDGLWIGSYFGLIAFGTNPKLVAEPATTWADLEASQYRGQVVLNGDPRESGSGFAAVIAAALAHGGSYEDITPGIDYFGRLAQSGNLRIETITTEGITSGAIPIALDWAYNFTAARSQLSQSENGYAISVPRDGIYGSYYAQSITANAEHPCAARLWMEQMLGDAGAISRLNGLAIPARLASIEAFGLVPESVRPVLPATNEIYTFDFPTQRQLETITAQLDEEWDTKVTSKLATN